MTYVGYDGDRCENVIDSCATVDCHNGSCINGDGDYVCECIAGYTGQLCDVEINECASNPCQHGGTCHDRVGHFDCRCPPGTSGKQTFSFLFFFISIFFIFYF